MMLKEPPATTEIRVPETTFLEAYRNQLERELAEVDRQLAIIRGTARRAS